MRPRGREKGREGGKERCVCERLCVCCYSRITRQQHIPRSPTPLLIATGAPCLSVTRHGPVRLQRELPAELIAFVPCLRGSVRVCVRVGDVISVCMCVCVRACVRSCAAPTSTRGSAKDATCAVPHRILVRRLAGCGCGCGCGCRHTLSEILDSHVHANVNTRKEA